MDENELENVEDRDLVERDQEDPERDDLWEIEEKERVRKALQDLSPEAIATLRKVMKDGPPREARQAAETVLSRTGFSEQRRARTGQRADDERASRNDPPSEFVPELVVGIHGR